MTTETLLPVDIETRKINDDEEEEEQNENTMNNTVSIAVGRDTTSKLSRKQQGENTIVGDKCVI